MVVTGNWNDVTDFGRSEDGERARNVLVPGGGVMRRLVKIFEQIGYDVDWSDGVSMCGGCNKAIQTEPDSYSWTPDFVVGDGDIHCTTCMEDGGWQDELDSLCHSRGALSNSSVDPSKYGFRPVVELSVGFDGYHDADRCKRELDACGVGLGYFLQLSDNRQFGCTAIVWVERDSETPDDLHGDDDVAHLDNWTGEEN